MKSQQVLVIPAKEEAKHSKPGGHTIDSVEPIYGLVVRGIVLPSRVKKNSGAKAYYS